MSDKQGEKRQSDSTFSDQDFYYREQGKRAMSAIGEEGEKGPEEPGSRMSSPENVGSEKVRMSTMEHEVNDLRMQLEQNVVRLRAESNTARKDMRSNLDRLKEELYAAITKSNEDLFQVIGRMNEGIQVMMGNQAEMTERQDKVNEEWKKKMSDLDAKAREYDAVILQPRPNVGSVVEETVVAGIPSFNPLIGAEGPYNSLALNPQGVGVATGMEVDQREQGAVGGEVSPIRGKGLGARRKTMNNWRGDLPLHEARKRRTMLVPQRGDEVRGSVEQLADKVDRLVAERGSQSREAPRVRQEEREGVSQGEESSGEDSGGEPEAGEGRRRECRWQNQDRKEKEKAYNRFYKDLEIYDGKIGFDNWWSKVELISRRHGVTDVFDIKTGVYLRISGQAGSLVTRDLTPDRDDGISLEEFMEKLRERLDPKSRFFEACTLFETREQGTKESIDMYIIEKDKLYLRIPEKQRQERVCEGGVSYYYEYMCRGILNPRLRMKIREKLRFYKSEEELKSEIIEEANVIYRASQLGEIPRDRGFGCQTRNREAVDRTVLKNELSVHELGEVLDDEDLGGVNEVVKQNAQGANYRVNKNPIGNLAKGRCWWCGQTGHQKRECPKRLSGVPRSVAVLKFEEGLHAMGKAWEPEEGVIYDPGVEEPVHDGEQVLLGFMNRSNGSFRSWNGRNGPAGWGGQGGAAPGYGVQGNYRSNAGGGGFGAGGGYQQAGSNGYYGPNGGQSSGWWNKQPMRSRFNRDGRIYVRTYSTFNRDGRIHSIEKVEEEKGGVMACVEVNECRDVNCKEFHENEGKAVESAWSGNLDPVMTLMKGSEDVDSDDEDVPLL